MLLWLPNIVLYCYMVGRGSIVLLWLPDGCYDSREHAGHRAVDDAGHVTSTQPSPGPSRRGGLLLQSPHLTSAQRSGSGHQRGT